MYEQKSWKSFGMRRMVTFVVVVGLVLATSVVAWAAGSSIDPASRTVDTGTITVEFSSTTPDEIGEITWDGSGNLTQPWGDFCGDGHHEFWGNAWANVDGPGFVSLVGWGSSGSWDTNAINRVATDTRSEDCPGSAEVSVTTSYGFFSGGPAADRITVKRTFDFGDSPFENDFRPYIPRMSPRDDFNQVLHPNAVGTALVVEDALACEFGCVAADWDGSWYAIHHPGSGSGLIVRHHPSPVAVALWVDVDGGSFANASSVMLLAPLDGFTGKVTERQTLCFYDETTWPSAARSALTLPPSC